MKITIPPAIAAVAAVLVLSACSASGGTGTTSGGGSGSGGSSSSSSPASIASATITGDYTGTIVANNCISAGIMSISAVIGGTKYPGSISAKEASFVGPAAVDFATAPDKDPSLPTVSSDGNTFTLASVHLYDEIGGKSVVLNGTVTCP